MFVHLHVHSEFSLLDGSIRLDRLVQRCRELEMPAVAVTDHGCMFGLLDFYLKARDAGIKPILGFEGYFTEGSRFDRVATRGRGPYHLTLLARDLKGYRNLCKLSSLAYLEGFYNRPRFDWESLAEHSEGLLALTGCLKGAPAAHLLAGDRDAAAASLGRLAEILGRENVYVELMDHGIPEQHQVNPELIRLARAQDLPLVATNDCHYLNRSDAEFHDMLLCIQTGKKVDDTDRMRFSNDQFYLKSPEEMATLFADFPEAIANTQAVAERCQVELDLDQLILPDFPVPDELDHDGYLRQLCRDGLRERLIPVNPSEEQNQQYQERLAYELDVIRDMGFSAYFLVVWDFILWSRKQGIPVGPGRGSAAGSLVAFVLRITDIDPLQYDLYFERFLNPGRSSMPDIDIDFCTDRRDEVIRYVAEKYGRDHVAHIITFGTMKARAAIRDVARVLDFSYSEADKVAKMVPAALKMTLQKAYELEPELARLKKTDPRYRRLLEGAEWTEGLSRHASTHAAGVVIAREPLTEYLPLTRDPKGGDLAVTQFSMNWVDQIGLLKVDFLGLNNLTILDRAVRLVALTREQEIDLDHLPLDDKATYELIARGETFGVFQLESSGMRAWLKKLRPNRFEDVIAMVALYRPGPMDYIPTFIDAKNGKAIQYLDPCLEPILAATYGVVVYQEQIMRIVRDFAGFSLAEGYDLIKAISKKKEKVVARLRARFLEQAVERGKPRKVAEEVFAFIEPFAGYGFNKSHSTAYALIAYQTAYLKANFTVEFMAAYLSSVSGDSDSVLKYIRECRKMEIPILPPDVNESFADFTVVSGSIRFGLAAVKNVGGAAVEAIIQARKEDGPFQSIYDFCERVDLGAVNRRVVESLIKCGAAGGFQRPRAQLCQVLDTALAQGQKAQADRNSGQGSLFGWAQEEGSEVGLPEQYPECSEWPRSRFLSFEKDALGFYITGHPLARFSRELGRCTNASSGTLRLRQDRERVTMGGLIGSIRRLTTRKGDPMAILQVEDLEGTFKAVVLPKVFADYRQEIAEEAAVLIDGRVESSDRDLGVQVDSLQSLSQAVCRQVRAVRVSQEVGQATQEQLSSIRGLLQRHPGDTPVRLRLLFPGDISLKEVEAALPTEHGVEPTDSFLDDAEELLGAEAVELI